jgi:hypothetical protein
VQIRGEKRAATAIPEDGIAAAQEDFGKSVEVQVIDHEWVDEDGARERFEREIQDLFEGGLPGEVQQFEIGSFD